jgi:hypothetical protein
MATHVVNDFPVCVKPGCSLQCLQTPVTRIYPNPEETNEMYEIRNFTAVRMSVLIFWVLKSCGLVGREQLFG